MKPAVTDNKATRLRPGSRQVLSLGRSAARITLLTALSLTLIAAYAEVRFRLKTSPLSDWGPPQVWAHRGYHHFAPENSLAAFRAAFASGARGVELDVFFHRASNRFLVSHDLPASMNPSDNLILETVFSSFGRTGYYWVDFKNLLADSVDASGARLVELAARFHLGDRLLVQSRNGLALRKLSRLGIATIYWIEPRGGILGRLDRLRYKLVIAHSDFAAISVPHRVLDADFLAAFAHLPIFTFTVNDERRLEELRSTASITVIVTDEALFR